MTQGRRILGSDSSNPVYARTVSRKIDSAIPPGVQRLATMSWAANHTHHPTATPVGNDAMPSGRTYIDISVDGQRGLMNPFARASNARSSLTILPYGGTVTRMKEAETCCCKSTGCTCGDSACTQAAGCQCGHPNCTCND